MARIRMIKPEFFIDEFLGTKSPEARLLFAGLWCIADREGRLEDRPARIKLQTLPYDDVNINELLNTLVDDKDGVILRYAVNGNNYIQIINFIKHQHVHIKENPSTIPPPPGWSTNPNQFQSGANPVPEPDKNRFKPPDPTSTSTSTSTGQKKEFSRHKIEDFVADLWSRIDTLYRDHNLPSPYDHSHEQIMMLKEIAKECDCSIDPCRKYAHEAVDQKILGIAVYEHILAGLRGGK